MVPLRASQLTTRIVSAPLFQRMVIAAILLSAILIGLETYPEIMATHGESIRWADRLLIYFFVFEISLKLVAQGRTFWRFFREPWNLFDFVIVGVCLLPASPQFLVVLRLFRILRVLRLITTIPKLQLLVGALFKSIPSMGYVVLLLTVHFYIYAVLGTFLFGNNDATHFGSLGKSTLTLFQVVTLEGWVEVMGAQMVAFPRIAPVYFISFIVSGTMIILNLFIGVVVNSMAETQQELDAAKNKFCPRTIQKELSNLKGILERLEKQLDSARLSTNSTP